ncbi:kunitz-type protease inhibitor 1-like [Dunckerocampus dactyliophorus]|uniref:kunitz-type protease inhibitor 1-like n=1 Tax=Dunckerocampus dactyliophorus TaxID=161453 RepID=UPI002405F4BB|nr:kunitz-type protease inhibitor 1-like [Dunckerocampus dactyliophorus]
MPSSPSFLFLLLLVLPRDGGAAEDANCVASFRSGQDDFVLDLEDAVKAGAALLAVAQAPTMADCRRACCEELRCNVALMEPRDEHGNLTCTLYDCVNRNHFVCRFVKRQAYRSFIRETEYRKYLEGPLGPAEQAPPIANAGRDRVVQPGATVTLNGIESLAVGNAHIVDYRWTVQSADADVIMEETDLLDQVRLSNLLPGRYRFRLTVTDSNDQSHSAEVGVLVLSPQMATLYCLAPTKVGPCRAAFPRWHYHADAGECQPFTFGGCKGNHNNFLSKDECMKACAGVLVTSSDQSRIAVPAGEVCGVACLPDQLTCSNGCCVDKSLECDGVIHCSNASDEDHCSQLNQTFSRLLDLDVNQKKARCTEAPRTGPCRASHTRWYYNPLNTRCQRFTYGGCNGSDNNFVEETECDRTCHGVTEKDVFARGTFERFEEEESNSGSIALAVVLSVAILAVLAILAYCFLKSRRKRLHQNVAASPAHQASEQYTLVYNGTTNPA